MAREGKLDGDLCRKNAIQTLLLRSTEDNNNFAGRKIDFFISLRTDFIQTVLRELLHFRSENNRTALQSTQLHLLGAAARTWADILDPDLLVR